MNTEELHEWKRLNDKQQKTQTELNHCNTDRFILKTKGLDDYNAARKSGLLEKKLDDIYTEIETFARKHFSNNA